MSSRVVLGLPGTDVLAISEGSADRPGAGCATRREVTSSTSSARCWSPEEHGLGLRRPARAARTAARVSRLRVVQGRLRRQPPLISSLESWAKWKGASNSVQTQSA